MAAALEQWQGEDVSLAGIERALGELRDRMSGGGQATTLRTSVMTHIAWVPPDWRDRAWAALGGMRELHPSRTLILVPHPEDGAERIDASVSLECFHPRELERNVCTEVVELRLLGATAAAPASVVEPLLVSDLPVFLRWRGQPPFGAPELDQLVGVADRLIVDSTEWPDLPDAYRELAGIFPRAATSDIAWARTGRWRALLASLWPQIASVDRIRVHGTRAQAFLLAGWLRSRLEREIELEHAEADVLQGIALDGEPAPFPPGQAPTPSELLSDELDRYVRDPVYEAAVAAA
ncbi:MAG TPA: glucose-6-phosphate dehydrogenase assembly protein OpcA [Gaiellaceae bacterium]|nr:glucose-6-phosphate dehydrogenase assembly protein OpcA [Gaiellaceae bacterium]